MSGSGPIVGVGELLWDMLPGGPQPGGAPFNFAFHCHQLGHDAVIVSRVGDDDLGERLRAEVRARGLTDELIQVDASRPTGTVQVQVDLDGQPRYSITENVGYDFLEWTPELQRLAMDCRAVCFGTLAQRSGRSRETIQRFVAEARARQGPAKIVFDINLRAGPHQFNGLESSFDQADWLKLNIDELDVLASLFELPRRTDVDAVQRLGQRFMQLELICLTRGEHGCLVWTRGGNVVDHPGIPIVVADTVGAGDAFTAGLLTQVLEGKPLNTAVEFANRLAAIVATRPGGTPRIDRAEVEELAR